MPIKKYKSKFGFWFLIILIGLIFFAATVAKTSEIKAENPKVQSSKEYPQQNKRNWIDILSALLTPTIAIAGIGIGIFQWKINQKRLQHELFERRIKLYEIITTHIANGISHGTFDNNEEMQFLRDTKHARFVFDKNIADFVDEIYKKSIDLSFLSRREQQLKGAALEKTMQKRTQVFKWFQEELNNIQNRFEKYLQL